MAYNNVDVRLREWAPLTDLFSKLPTKFSNGFFAPDVKITCLDALTEFLALGTNSGIIYWYDRKKKDLQRLRCEKQNVQITAIKIISTVDYMLACGGRDGNVNIFQIPKTHPDTIPENLKPKIKQQIERYTVSDLHKASITAIEWSKNGMKLFSGDKNGCIVLTEIDFYMHICKSVEILNETYEVVQLSYQQQKLLVSTTYRSIICHKQDRWKVSQVGTKDRKVLGRFGGVIYQNGPKPHDIILYCTRPGLRLWLADYDGNVEKTLLFKELLNKECPEVPIINPISKNMKLLKPQQEPSFGIILPFNENLLLTHNNDVIYILDPKNMTVVATMSHFRSVLWVATHKDEIFVLEEERSIIRISYKPESGVISPTTSSVCGNSFFPLSTSIKDLTNKLQSTSIIPAINPFLNQLPINDFNIHTDETLIMNAEEAKETIKTDNYNSIDIEKKFNDIGKQEFSDQILFKENRRRNNNSKERKTNMAMSMTSLSSNSSEEKDLTTNYFKPTLMTLSSVGILPDLRSPESIQNDIEYKEKILADILDLDKIKINLDHLNETKIEESPPTQSPIKLNQMDRIETNPSPPITYNLTKSSSDINKIEEESIENTPKLIHIPNDWKLSEIQLNSVKSDTLSDTSLTDWEIL